MSTFMIARKVTAQGVRLYVVRSARTGEVLCTTGNTALVQALRERKMERRAVA